VTKSRSYFSRVPKSYAITANETIQAPVEKVFQTLAQVEHFSKAVPGIQKIEFLGDKRYGVGTRFRETRIVNGREAAAELEVAELRENESIRLVTTMAGTLWDTAFNVSKSGSNACAVAMTASAHPKQFAAKLLTPMIMGMIRRALTHDLLAVKKYCEAR
jgi:carbon monoxide dehydrogenase subunit G